METTHFVANTLSFVLFPHQSKDGKGTELWTLHTFFLYVGDAPDNPPFWSGIVPFYELDECQEEVS